MSLTGFTQAGTPLATIQVRVYDTARLSSRFEQRALLEAERVLGTAQVHVRWQRCAGRDLKPSPACGARRSPVELSLRILPGDTTDHRRPTALGNALVSRRAGAGVLATVYADRVQVLANAAGTDAATLLGRVAAHELGHLLMHTARHPRHGLMRSRWTRDEVRMNRAADWAFTAEDVKAIQRPGVVAWRSAGEP